MTRKKQKWTVGSAVLALVLGLIWHLTPVQPVFAIAQLSDRDKLATLGERGANPRLNKIIYWMFEAYDRGGSPQAAVEWAQRLNGETGLKADLVHEALMRNWTIARELGLLTPENVQKLRLGSAAEVTYGAYLGEPVEVDHVIPYSVAPGVGNELANLELLPRPVNRRKSAEVSERQIELAERLHQAGLLPAETLDRVRQGSGR